tara:strand:- start:32 stop:184 length:153 start_codon:yes stop_codon:yes gene_type:complete
VLAALAGLGGAPARGSFLLYDRTLEDLLADGVITELFFIFKKILKIKLKI